METPFVRPTTYGLIAAYILAIIISVNLTWGDGFQYPHLNGTVFRDAANAFRVIPPALRAVQEKALKQAALRPLLIIGLICFATCLLFVYILPLILNYAARAFSLSARESKLEKRVIEKQERDDSSGSWFTSTDRTPNAVCTAILQTDSRLKLFICALAFGAGRYLSGGVQVWCLCISLMQLYMFGTGKSFWPLIVFTAIIALICALEELRKSARDAEQNGRKLVRLEYPVHSLLAAVEKPDARSGELAPGDVIRLRPGNVVPADALILRVTPAPSAPQKSPRGGKSGRVILGMNEASVTGETAIIRKAPFPDPERIKKISFTGEYGTKAMINGDTPVPDGHIAFANSIVVALSTQSLVVDAVILWVGNETKALRPSIGPEITLRKNPSPLSAYMRKGFVLSVSALLILALLDTTVSVRVALANADKVIPLTLLPLFTLFVNHMMYLNMIVPQATEQMRLAVSHMLARHFKSDAQCNDPWCVDVLSAVTRIVTDKTGTLTQNKMQTMGIVVTDPAGSSHVVTDSIGRDIARLFDSVAIAVIATTGVEPEEIAMKEKLESLNYTMRDVDIPDPDDCDAGSIRYNSPVSGNASLRIIASFGFHRELLAKAVLFTDTSDSARTFIAIQAGGDEFWSKVGSSNALTLATLNNALKLAEKEQVSGAPRNWSYGIADIPEEAARQLLSEWRAAKLHNPERLTEILASRLTRVRLLAKVNIVDLYRPKVASAIHELTSAGKQVVMCTGDSRDAAMLIARDLGFPVPQVIQEGTVVSVDKQLTELLSNSHEPRTFFITQPVMEILRKDGRASTKLYELLGMQVRNDAGQLQFLHRAVFCRATPELKPWVVELLQGKHAQDYLVEQRTDYVMAVGDGANDLNMIRVADVSLGIESGNNEDICNQASLRHKGWADIVSLLHEDGVQKALMLATMVKLIFLKHWMMAGALWMHLLVSGFPLVPKDPCNPLITAFFNAVVFSQISSHAASDALSEVKALVMRKVMSLRALVRWAAAAALSGVACFIAVRVFVPRSSEETLGVLLQVSQMFAVTVYLVSVTNTWTVEHSSPAPVSAKRVSYDRNSEMQLIMGCCSAMLACLLVIGSVYLIEPLWKVMCLFAALVCLHPGLYFFRVLIHDVRFIRASLRQVRAMDRGTVFSKAVAWSHTKNGRVLLSVSFALFLRYLTAESLPLLVTTGLVAAALSALIFLMVLSNMGVFRALEKGQLGAIAIAAFAIGFLLGICFTYAITLNSTLRGGPESGNRSSA